MATTGAFLRYPRRAKIFSTVLLLLAAAGLIWAVFGLPAYIEAEQPPELQVTYLDVGRGGLIGEAILLQSSEGRVALIDGGCSGAGIVPLLAKRGVTHIDLVVITHGHDDHMGGLVEVLRAFPVDQVAYNRQRFKSPLFQEFEKAVHEREAAYTIVHAGSMLPFGSLAFEVLAPPEFDPETINNNSLILRLADRRVTFLFTGDSEKQEEDWLVQQNVPLRADILKVAHHGADTSTSPEFVARVQPSAAIYSVGAGNDYGFPQQRTIDTLTAAGARIYGTDNYGTITIRTDGENYTITTERSGPEQP